MKIFYSIFLFFIGVIFFSCSPNTSNSCRYKLQDLLASDTPKVVITLKHDTIIEVKDYKSDRSSGVYTFDKDQGLRFYGFFVNDNDYRYSELYDSMGNIIKTEGSPLVEYRIWKQQRDTVLFNAFLFSLNKKFEDIEIISNKGDTIRPQYLYRTDIYSNMKCFPFKLSSVEQINNLVLYTKGSVINICTKKKETFSDTTSFDEIKW